MIIRPLLCLSVLSALPAAGLAGTFSPPKGCTAYLTVQARNCTVTHHWTCEADAPGEKWSGEITPAGLVYLGKIDAEAQWIASYYLTSNQEETLILPAKDPASLRELIENGVDTYDFTLSTPNGVNRVVGYDRILERDVFLDGQDLHRTEYSIRITDEAGELVFAAEGSEYVSEAHGRFFSGAGEVTGPEAYSYNDTPVDFITPGAPGFLSDTPLYGCDAQTARFELNKKDPKP